MAGLPDGARHRQGERLRARPVSDGGGGRLTAVPFHPLDLGWTLVRTEFKTRYHGTLGGFCWALLKPSAMVLTLMGVFSYVFATDSHYPLNLVVGLFLWDFFAEATKAGLVSLHTNGFLLTKAKFPSWVLVVSSISNALITLVAFTAVILVFLLAFGRPPDARALALFAWYLAHFVAMVVGISLAASVWFLRFRDLNQVWEVLMAVGFFVTPIIYPIDILPERAHAYLYIWPPTPVIQFAKSVLVEGAVPTLRAHLLLSGETLAIVALGLIVFRRYGPRAAEYL